ncbi:MotA/TolQ/ExbB proton channel family protein [Methylobacillus gramineus]|uniref:MotA/TolQ/ExbB proton channel family protein n=1 Tax=Methylobacillus gramineus TaxID=755169 RepID=UPI001CFFFAB5|nr:MotA/TolQ/ExbB proton channel family protein [Methylobacillus gramineus]MCB5184405.1 MotA/TolQ/ExbB proton channel family protein [Methylobacillus gramineus]
MFDIENSKSLIVDGVLYSLIAFSVVTWTLLLVKGFQHWRASSQTKRYKKEFWSAPNILAAAEIQDVDGPAARVANAGFHTLRDVDTHVSNDLEHTGDRQDLLERSLRQQILKERRSLDSGLAILASIGSTSPFVGLFGTVWGIMNALTNIGALGSASLEVVAGPIGEALVATGLGIAVAVPAVLAYNFFTRRLKLISGDLDDFAADLIRLSRKVNFSGKAIDLSASKQSTDTNSSVVNLKNEAFA